MEAFLDPKMQPTNSGRAVFHIFCSDGDLIWHFCGVKFHGIWHRCGSISLIYAGSGSSLPACVAFSFLIF
jgi:hypothetical protein